MTAVSRALGNVALALAVALGSACRGRSPEPPSAAQKNPLQAWDYREGMPPDSAKVFLVAGGDDIANFAAEIVEQRQLWLRAGLRPEEIACYWARPPVHAYREDREQYDAVADAMRACYRAEPGTVLEHLAAAAEHAPPWVFVYVTGHGLGPIMRWRARTPDPELASERLGLTPAEMAALDQHSIGLQAGPGPQLEDVATVVQRFRAGYPPRTLMFSPSTLAEALAAFPRATPKFVVLQACYSGGFIERPEGESPLHDIGALTLLTATTFNRPSFGCGAGRAKTYFGGAFNRVLDGELQPDARPPDLDWSQIHARIAFVIDVMEAIDAERASAPRLLQTP